LRVTSSVGEYVWFIVPICGLLWQIGGTFNRWYRRAGVPCVIFISCLLCGISWLSALSSSILLYIVTTLPLTLIGDDITKHWQNWVWIWILGLLYALPSQVLQLSLSAELIGCILVGSLGTLSNLPMSHRFAPWKLVEFCYGSFVAYSFCVALSSF
jgi:hypothetical protein